MPIEIADAEGRTIRTPKGSGRAGVNRVWWDLKYESSRRPRLRTSPVGRPDIGVGTDGTRPFPGGGTLAPIVPPGTYTVKLRAGGTEQSRPLVVRRDPNSLGSEEGIRAQATVALEMRDKLNAFADLIDDIEIARSQIADIKVALARDARWKILVDKADELDGKLLAVEAEFFDPHTTSAGDSFYYPPGLFSKLQGLAGGLMDSDFQPTKSQLEVYAIYNEQWMAQRGRFDRLFQDDLPSFNRLLTESGVPHVVGKTP